MKVKVLKMDVIKNSVWPEGSILDESILTPAEMQALIAEKRVVEIKNTGNEAPWEQPDVLKSSKEKKKS